MPFVRPNLLFPCVVLLLFPVFTHFTAFLIRPSLKIPADMAARVFGPLITQPAAGRHSATLIMLHGLGDTGEGMARVV